MSSKAAPGHKAFFKNVEHATLSQQSNGGIPQQSNQIYVLFKKTNFSHVIMYPSIVHFRQRVPNHFNRIIVRSSIVIFI